MLMDWAADSAVASGASRVEDVQGSIRELRNLGLFFRVTTIEWPVLRHDSCIVIPNRFELVKGVYNTKAPEKGAIFVIFGNHSFGGGYMGHGFACEEALFAQSTDLVLTTTTYSRRLKMKNAQAIVVSGVHMDTWWDADMVEKRPPSCLKRTATAWNLFMTASR